MELQETYALTNDIKSSIKAIDTWWSTAPIVNIAVDPYNVITWPTIWEMIYRGECCKYSKALAMSYNLYYIDSDLNIDIYRIHDIAANDMYIIAVVDNEYVINYNGFPCTLLKDVLLNISIEEKWNIKDILHK